MSCIGHLNSDDRFRAGRSVVVSLSQTPATFKTHFRYRHESEVVGHPMRWPYPRLEAIVSGVIIDVTRQPLTDVHDLAARSPNSHEGTNVAMVLLIAKSLGNSVGRNAPHC